LHGDLAGTRLEWGKSLTGWPLQNDTTVINAGLKSPESNDRQHAQACRRRCIALCEDAHERWSAAAASATQRKTDRNVGRSNLLQRYCSSAGAGAALGFCAGAFGFAAGAVWRDAVSLAAPSCAGAASAAGE
jgi:hypothetical protein